MAKHKAVLLLTAGKAASRGALHAYIAPVWLTWQLAAMHLGAGQQGSALTHPAKQICLCTQVQQCCRPRLAVDVWDPQSGRGLMLYSNSPGAAKTTCTLALAGVSNTGDASKASSRALRAPDLLAPRDAELPHFWCCI